MSLLLFMYQLGQGVEEMLHGLAGRYCCSCISRVRVLRRCSMDWQAATVVHVSAESECSGDAPWTGRPLLLFMYEPGQSV